MESKAFTSYGTWTSSYFLSPSAMRDEQRIPVIGSSTGNELWTSEQIYGLHWQQFAVKKSLPESRRSKYDAIAEDMVAKHLDIYADRTAIFHGNEELTTQNNVDISECCKQFAEGISNSNVTPDTKFDQKLRLKEGVKRAECCEKSVKNSVDSNIITDNKIERKAKISSTDKLILERSESEKDNSAVSLETISVIVDIKSQSVQFQRLDPAVYIPPQTVVSVDSEIRPLLLDPGEMRVSADVQAAETTVHRHASPDSSSGLSGKASPPSTITTINFGIREKLVECESALQEMDKMDKTNADNDINSSKVNGTNVQFWKKLQQPLKSDFLRSAALESAVSERYVAIRPLSLDPWGLLSPAGLSAIKTPINQGLREMRRRSFDPGGIIVIS